MIEKSEWIRRLSLALLDAKSRGMTQADIAHKIGVQQSTVANWKAGRKEPGFEMINKLCSALDISETWLLHGSNLIEIDEETRFLLEKLKVLSDHVIKDQSEMRLSKQTKSNQISEEEMEMILKLRKKPKLKSGIESIISANDNEETDNQETDNKSNTAS